MENTAHGTVLESESSGAQILRERVLVRYGVVLVVVWLGSAVAAFWYFQGQFIRPFTDKDLPRVTARWFETSILLGVVDSTKPFDAAGLVVHFWDPACPCSRFSKSHTQELVKLAAATGIKTGLVVKPSGVGGEAKQLADAKALFPQSDWVISASELPRDVRPLAGSPSAAVLDKNNSIRYFGPYSSDAFCRVDGKGFVEKAIEGLKKTKVVSSNRQAFYTACYCDW